MCKLCGEAVPTPLLSTAATPSCRHDGAVLSCNTVWKNIQTVQWHNPLNLKSLPVCLDKEVAFNIHFTWSLKMIYRLTDIGYQSFWLLITGIQILVVIVVTSSIWQWCNSMSIQSCSDEGKTCQVQFISVYNVARLARSRVASGHHICHLPEVKVSLSSLTTDQRWNRYEETKITDMNKHGETSFWHQTLYKYLCLSSKNTELETFWFSASPQ